MERYSEYKDSGIFWVPEIPSNWNIRRLGHILQKKNRNRPQNAELLVCTNKATVIKRGNSKMGLVAESEEVYQGVRQGDLLIHGMDTWHGAIAISGFDGMCTPVVHVCTSNESVGYISFYLRYMAYMKVFKLISNGVRQNTSDFRSWAKVSVIPLPLPPLSEQQSIVSYLDSKCEKIDKMIEGKEKQIALLQELKQRTIADVVTRGLNPDVKMKATNISWLEEIPEHWITRRLGSLFTGDVETNKDFEFKRAFKFNYGQLVAKNEVGDPEEYHDVYVKYSKVRSGDILVNGLNLNYDFVSQRVACAPSEGIITSAYVVCRPREGVNYEYYTFLLKNMDNMKLFHGMGTGIRLTLSYKEIKKQIVPVPPLSEQRTIVAYINERTEKIDTLTSKLQQEIESIKEYKQRLISDVVTGKIKVC